MTGHPQIDAGRQLSDEAAKEFMAATEIIDWTQPDVHKLAQHLAGDGDPVRVAARCFIGSATKFDIVQTTATRSLRSQHQKCCAIEPVYATPSRTYWWHCCGRMEFLRDLAISG